MASMVLLVPFYLLLPVDQFGALAIYTTFSTLLQILITYSFDSSVYVHYHEFKSDPAKLARFLSSAFLFMAIIGLAALLLGSLGGDFLFRTIWHSTKVSFFPYGAMSVVTAVFQGFFKVHSGLVQSREKPSLFFWSNVLSFSLIAGLTLAGLLLFPKTLVGPVGGRMVAACITGSWAAFRILREFGAGFDFPLLRNTFAYNHVTFIYQVQQWIINSFDRILIGIYLTLTDVGTYDLAFKCMLLITFIVDGLNNSFQPKVIGIITAQTEKESTVIINRYYNGLMAVSMLLVCGVILFVPMAFDSGLIPDKYKGYRAAFQYIPYIGLLYFIRAIRYYFILPFSVLKYVKPLPVIYLFVSVLKVALMIILIRSYHVYAVIASAGFSSLVEVTVLYYVLKGKFHFRFNLFKLIIAPVFLAAMILSLETMSVGPEHARHAVYLLLCGILLVWVYRNELKLIKVPGFTK